MTTTTTPAASVNYQSDSTKLASLLVLATGAVAMPQTGSADIIYTDMNSNPVFVGYTGSAQFLFDNLPGTVRFGFVRTEYSTGSSPSTLNFRTVVAGDLGGALNATAMIQAKNGLAAHLPFGAAWDQGNALTSFTYVGWANTYQLNPATGYNREFLAFQFVDDSPAGGGGTRYGWAEVSLSMNYYPAGPNVTIWGYAYDNAGAKPAMGVVPEPNSGALLVMGAMALGARGLRNWRRNQEARCKS